MCPNCKKSAELSDDFSFVKCSSCSFDMTYGEYVKYIAYKDARYRNVLNDYKYRMSIYNNTEDVPQKSRLALGDVAE